MNISQFLYPGEWLWVVFCLDAPTLNACAEGALDGDGSVPTRFYYPLDEQTLNNPGYETGLTGLGGSDGLNVKLWWDVN